MPQGKYGYHSHFTAEGAEAQGRSSDLPEITQLVNVRLGVQPRWSSS
jgi:hypothetical protein